VGGEGRGKRDETWEVWHLGGVGLADVVDGDAVHPAILAAPGGKVALVLHDLCVLLGHGQIPFGVDGLGLLRHRHNSALLLLLLPVDAVGHAEGVLPVLDGGGGGRAGAGGEAPAPGGQVPAVGQAAASAHGAVGDFAVGRGAAGLCLVQGGEAIRGGVSVACHGKRPILDLVHADSGCFSLTPRGRQDPCQPQSAVQD
jgi:hypothetical protein